MKKELTTVALLFITGCVHQEDIKTTNPDGSITTTQFIKNSNLFAPSVTLSRTFDCKGQICDKTDWKTDGKSVLDQVAAPAAIGAGLALSGSDIDNNSGSSSTAQGGDAQGGNATAGAAVITKGGHK